MTDQEVYELLLHIDTGYTPTDTENCRLASIEKLTWTSVQELPASIKYLDNITVLDLSNTGVSDIRALSCLRTLIRLDLKNTKVSNIRTLFDFMALSSLDLSNTNVSDIQALSRLQALESLCLRNTKVNNIRCLSGLTALTILDLSKTEVSDIRALSRLTSLERLDLHDTRVNDIRVLSRLATLKILDLQHTRIIDIFALSHLIALRKLNLAETGVYDISPLSDLRTLKNLSLNKTKVNDIRNLSNLTELTTLNLEDTEVEDISTLAGLNSLTDLNLCNTKVRDIRILSALKKMTTLYMRGTAVSDIEALSDLKSLTSLDLSEDKNLTDISSLSNLTKLTSLYLNRTNVSDITALSNLKKLTTLDLRELQLNAIPEFLLDLRLDFIEDDSLFNKGIFIHGLKLTSQPIEVFSQNRALINAYYRSQENVPINECKVFFLGDAEAGKTHSIKRLINKGKKLTDFDGNSTPGIEISVSSTTIEGNDIVINYWDFGGQEIQHSMHRMFLTERAVYVVFLNARQDPLDDRARYWLENICSFAQDAPVLLVINKMDQNERPKFNEDGIRNDYGSRIKKIVRMSALKDEPEVFMEELQGSINDIIRELPTVSSKVPRSWKTLMETIRTMPDHYLTTDQFKEHCSTCGVRDYNMIHDDLVDLFQTIGISFCYYKNRSLADYMILNPKWLVNAIYTIISNSKAAANNGVITQEDLYDLLKNDALHGVPIRRVIPNLRYESYQVNYILGVIRMFHLSYPLKDGSEFFPMLCDGNEKISVDKVMSENALHYIFRYTYLPANVMHRLVVEMQRDLKEEYVWYSGAVFRNDYQKQTAYIHTKGNDLHIYVDALDPYYNPNEYLTPIQSIVRAINSDMNLSAKGYMTYREGDNEAEIAETILKGNLKNGIERGYVEKIDKIIDYKDVARRFEDIRPKIKGILLSNIIKALSSMQNEKAYFKTKENSHELEDLRNRYVSSQILMAGYNYNDQQTGGISKGGRLTGERDIVFRNKNGQDILIYEGLNLTGFNKKSIDDHLHKLMENYNPQGLPYGVLVSYVDCDRTRFNGIADTYRNHITDCAPENYVCIGQARIIPTIGQYLKCMEMDYECTGQYFTIYHILVGMVEQM